MIFAAMPREPELYNVEVITGPEKPREKPGEKYSMTTISNQDDFLRALSDNPEWRAAVRARILGEELLQLPAKFDAFVEQMTGYVAEMQGFIREQKEINDRIGRRLDTLDSNVSRLTDDTGWLKSFVTREAAVRDAQIIAMDMGLGYVRTTTREELYRMAMDAAQGKALSNDLRSFRRGDLAARPRKGWLVKMEPEPDGDHWFGPLRAVAYPLPEHGPRCW